MSTAGSPTSAFSERLDLFTHTEVFIYVFMEIITKTSPIRRVIFKNALLKDYIIFIIAFGIFSILGARIGSEHSLGTHLDVRDIAPMVAGLVAGPVVGLAVGLIGGIYRLSLGGITVLPGTLATVLAGLLAGLVYRYNKEKILGIIPSMIFAIAIELLHAGLILLFARPFDAVYEFVVTTFPQMIIAVSLGIGISMIIIHATLESQKPVTREKDGQA